MRQILHSNSCQHPNYKQYLLLTGGMLYSGYEFDDRSSDRFVIVEYACIKQFTLLLYPSLYPSVEL